ncbi:tetratricopeptide repeat-containing sensor histidine kinase [Niabella hibiscisoli]|uniref:tetratricopeptide repeat-containing sensor histidine kinase n=1 Tax=Niabella hibiscisoli TaxID=1825928 RepID=UPI001F116CEB|nr:sensor histidine kinase [Niabella hibiscisoli]MCH5715612.1 sensor histidine kinase [Niabella hibiscisoli]
MAQPGGAKDSLLLQLNTAKEDTAKIRLLLKVQNVYANKNYDSFYYYLSQAEALSQKLRTDWFDFYINAGYSEYYYYNNDYKKAIAYAQAGRDVAEKQNDLKLLAKSYNNLAAVYNRFGNHKYAINCILKCLDISEKTKDSISFPVRNLTASVTYYNLLQFDKAIVYAKKAYEFGKLFKNDFAIAMGLNNLSASYSQLNRLDSAIIISEQQLAFAKEQEDAVNTGYALINLCYDHFRMGNNAALASYADELTYYNRSLPDSQIIGSIRNAFALNLISQRRYDAAKIQLDSGINISLYMNNADALENLYQTGAILFYLQGKIKEGSYYAFKYDSIIRAANIKELNFYTEELETKYQTTKKENQIKLHQAQLKQQSALNYFLLACAAGLLMISVLTYRNYKHRKKLQQAKIDELETEKLLTATEAVLKGEEQERSRLAKDLHDGLGGMLSGIKHSLSSMKENLIMTPDNAQAFERSIDLLNSSITEMRRVAHNMMPETLVKYGLDTALKDFCAEITGSGAAKVNYQSIDMNATAISQTASVSVYRVAQELVNNAIKHGNASEVLVQLHLHQQEKLLALTVEDNGRGFDVNSLEVSKGIGWKNIQSRVDFLKGKLDIQSAQGKGTSVMIEINT